MGLSRRHRHCLECKGLFTPDYRNRTRQRFCSAPPCRRASKRASQARWCAKPANHDYFRGEANTERNRRWRAAHPGYWKRSHVVSAQQDPCSSQVVDIQHEKANQKAPAQQDPWDAQLVVLVGLIAQLAASTQQETIDGSLRRLHDLGHEVFAQASDAHRLVAMLQPLCPNGP